ncbi:MAG: hypothetical protein ACPHEP_05810 [Acidimicrobiales bacterium]
MENSKKTKVDTQKVFDEDKEGTQAKRIFKKYISDEGKGAVNNPRGKNPGLRMMAEIVKGLKYKDLDKESKNALSNYGMDKEKFDQMSKEITDLYNKSSERVTAGLKKGGAVKKKAKSPLFKVTNRGPLKKKTK